MGEGPRKPDAQVAPILIEDPRRSGREEHVFHPPGTAYPSYPKLYLALEHNRQDGTGFTSVVIRTFPYTCYIRYFCFLYQKYVRDRDLVWVPGLRS